MARGDVNEVAWALLEPLLPRSTGRRGRPWRDHRTVLNGILWVLRTGSPWRDLPKEYGPWQSAYDRFVRWRRDGTWQRIFRLLQQQADEANRIVWELCAVDGTYVRAHPHSAGARRQPSAADQQKGGRGIPKTKHSDAAEEA